MRSCQMSSTQLWQLQAVLRMRIIVLDCEDLPKWEGWNRVLWGSVFAISATDDFERFWAPAGELPTVEAVQAADLVIVTGSHYSAYEDLPWIHNLVAALPKFVATGTRILGCCFGHQVLSRALGGEVAPNPSGRFVLCVEDIEIDRLRLQQLGLLRPLAAAVHLPPPPMPPPPPSPSPSAAALEQAAPQQQQGAGGGGGVPDAGTPPLPPELQQQLEQHLAEEDAEQDEEAAASGGQQDLSSSNGGGGAAEEEEAQEGTVVKLRLLESHGDCVTRLPPGALLLGKSGTAQHEMWALGDNVLSFQFHPEMPPQVAEEKIWPAMTARGRLTPKESARAKRSLQRRPPHTSGFHALLQHFARHGLANSTSTTVAAENAPPTNAAAAAAAESSSKDASATSTIISHAATMPATAAPPPTAAAQGGGAAAGEPTPPAPPKPPPPLRRASTGRRSTGSAPPPEPSPKAAAAAAAAECTRRKSAEEPLGRLVAAAQAGVAAGLSHTLADCRQLAAMNGVAAGAAGAAADRAGELGQQCKDVHAQAQSVARVLDSLPQMEALLEGLTKVVDSLDVQSRALAAKLNVPDGGGVFSWLTTSTTSTTTTPAPAGAPAPAPR